MVNRDQRAGTRCIDRLAGPVKIHKIADPVRTCGWAHIGCRSPFDGCLFLGKQCSVTGVARSNEDTRLRAREALGRITRILNRLPGVGHQQTLLRFHLLRFPRRNAEEQWIEFGNAINKSAPFDVRFVRFSGRITVIIPPVPAVLGNFGDAIFSGHQIVPVFNLILGLWKNTAEPYDRNRFGSSIMRLLLLRHRGHRGSGAPMWKDLIWPYFLDIAPFI
ncbi:hypothetical protein D3C86_1017800 [compost metagenome]